MDRPAKEPDLLLATLAEFRFELRRFLHFSEAAALSAGLQPQQHQLLLQVAGAPAATAVTIAYVAERLGLKHNSTVELVDRSQREGLLVRTIDAIDRRRACRGASARHCPRHQHFLLPAREPGHGGARRFTALPLDHAPGPGGPLPALLPLALACVAGYLITSLAMPRSILTEKLRRRGYHLSREYGVDPLEMVSVADVMTENPQGLIGSWKAGELPEVMAYSDETCRAVAEEMATHGVLTMPVVDRETGRICGAIGAQELLAGRRRSVERESERNAWFKVGA